MILLRFVSNMILCVQAKTFPLVGRTVLNNLDKYFVLDDISQNVSASSLFLCTSLMILHIRNTDILYLCEILLDAGVNLISFQMFCRSESKYNLKFTHSTITSQPSLNHFLPFGFSCCFVS